MGNATKLVTERDLILVGNIRTPKSMEGHFFPRRRLVPSLL